VREGLEAYTAAGARLSGDGDRFGGIRPGMLADLVVLSESPLDAPIERVADIEIDMTLVGGRVVFERSTAFAYPDRIVGN
ncbi:MAG: amidohydrolase family protein, partial [Planctomycetota bacterium]